MTSSIQNLVYLTRFVLKMRLPGKALASLEGFQSPFILKIVDYTYLLKFYHPFILILIHSLCRGYLPFQWLNDLLTWLEWLCAITIKEVTSTFTTTFTLFFARTSKLQIQLSVHRLSNCFLPWRHVPSVQNIMTLVTRGFS